MYGYPPPMPAPMYRPEKSYLGEAILTLVLYYLGLGIVGLIANVIFLNNANRDERMGMLVRNKGCLQILLWFHIAAMIISCIVLVILMLTGTLATLISLASGGSY